MTIDAGVQQMFEHLKDNGPCLRFLDLAITKFGPDGGALVLLGMQAAVYQHEWAAGVVADWERIRPDEVDETKQRAENLAHRIPLDK